MALPPAYIAPVLAGAGASHLGGHTRVAHAYMQIPGLISCSQKSFLPRAGNTETANDADDPTALMLT